MSPTCVRLATRHLDVLPPFFVYRQGEPSHRGVQEILWVGWLEVVDQLLGRPGLPRQLQVGRSNSLLEAEPTDWEAFEAELGLDELPIRERAAAILGTQLFGVRFLPEWPPTAIPLPAPLVAMLMVTCRLDQIAGRKRFDLPHDGLEEVVREHPLPSVWGRWDELEVAAALGEYAGFGAVRAEGGLRTCFEVMYRPLRRRIEGRRWLLQAPPSLSPGILARVVDTLSEADKPKPAAEKVPAPAPKAPPLDSRRLNDFAVYLALASVLEPILRSVDNPEEAVRLEDAEVGRQLCRSVARLLRQGSVELYGRPGQEIVVALPHGDWQVDDRVAPIRVGAEPARYRVDRRGLRINGRVVAPGLVVPSGA